VVNTYNAGLKLASLLRVDYHGMKMDGAGRGYRNIIIVVLRGGGGRGKGKTNYDGFGVFVGVM